MKNLYLKQLKTPLLVVIAASTVGCSDGNSNGEPASAVADTSAYRAEIVWTEYGIPHITASSWADLGYGAGYAYAQLNYCQGMRQVLRFSGEKARFFGEEAVTQDVEAGISFNDATIQALYLDNPVPEVIGQLEGYAAGMNRYLRETGVDNLPEGELGCRNAPWVREVTTMDLAKVMHAGAYANFDTIISEFVLNVQGPSTTATAMSPQALEQQLEQFDRAQYVASIRKPPPGNIGSNAYAIGGDASQNGRGLVLANPHLDWAGNEAAFTIMHLTMGDEFDAMGVATAANPRLYNGFNAHIAWASTYSYGSRFMLYELELNPSNPLQYFYDGELRDIETHTLEIEYLTPDGTLDTLEYTYYRSHFGLIVDPGGDIGGWPNPFGTIVTAYSPRETNNRLPGQYIRMGQAHSMAEFKEALRSVGVPASHILAADRYGDAFYGDISAAPNITQSQIDRCAGSLLSNILEEAGYPLLDGSLSACAPGNDTDTAEGIRGFDNLPQIDTREYVANANQGFWMINPRIIIDSFPDYMGGRGSVNPNDQLFPRPRQLFLQAEQRLNGLDDLGEPGFSVDNLRELLFGSRSMLAENLNPELVEICSAVDDWSPYSDNPDEVAMACRILADWDLRYRVDSVGTHIFAEYEYRRFINRVEPPPASLYRIEFDPSDPFNTPSGIIRTDAWLEATKRSLAEAVDFILKAGVPLDSEWGDIQYVEKGGNRYPLAGGSSRSLLNVVDTTDFSNFDSILSNGFIGNRSNAVFGNTYVSVVGWDDSECPDAYGVLATSQSTDPASPHYADSTALFSQSGWIDMPFCETDRDAQEIRRETISEPRVSGM